MVENKMHALCALVITINHIPSPSRPSTLTKGLEFVFRINKTDTLIHDAIELGYVEKIGAGYDVIFEITNAGVEFVKSSMKDFEVYIEATLPDRKPLWQPMLESWYNKNPRC
jgi:hypothetical protein